jgi:hypothetical protein
MSSDIKSATEVTQSFEIALSAGGTVRGKGAWVVFFLLDFGLQSASNAIFANLRAVALVVCVAPGNSKCFHLQNAGNV